MSIGGQINLAASPWTRIAPRLGEPALAVLVDTKSAATQVRTMLTGTGGEPQAQKALIVLAPVMPLLEDTKLAGLAFSLGEKQGLHGYALADDASAAERVAETLRAVVTLGQNTLRQLRSRASTRPPQEQALLATFLPIAERLLESAQVRTEGTDVTLVAEAGDSAAIALGLILPAVQNAREAARRQQSMNNLKQIALAFHNYHADHGHFPPAVIDSPTVVGGKSFPRSWRVELLPYLEQDALYREYRKDEPWDSELNKRLLERMPAVYKDPSDATERTNTSYFVLTGPETMFSGTGKAMSDVKDGTSNTILAVEARRDVPWMKPEDIPFDPNQAADLLQKQVGGNHEAGFIVALVDGSVRFVSKAIDAGVWNGLVTPDGGEIVDPGSDPRPASAVSAP
jgi:type II secretory pathway pseudopilin PulG